jgi:hypothetical protein
MTGLRQAVDDYLRLRRSLGHQMNEAAYLLPDFADFLHDRGEHTVTIAAALDWVKAREPGGGHDGQSPADHRRLRLRPLPERDRPGH